MSNKKTNFLIGSINKEKNGLIELQYDCYGESNNHSVAKAGRTFVDHEERISVKSEYTRQDYDWFRQNSNLTPQEVINHCQRAYENFGIIRNIVDTMSEFSTQGVRIVHKNQKTQKFCEEWWRRVNGSLVSERFVNMLVRLGNVPINIAYAKIKLPVEKEMTNSTVDIVHRKNQLNKIALRPIEYEDKEIPFGYTFIHPNDIIQLGGDLSLFLGKPYYAMKIPTAVKSKLGNSYLGIDNTEVRQQYEKRAKELSKYLDKNANVVNLDQDRFDIYFYKKDDWQMWATPVISSVLKDLAMLEKLKLADLSALDGAISNIRHWTVGIVDPANIQNSILPTREGINKIKNILSNSLGGGTMDLVTGPEVKFQESKSEVYKFLGSEKYQTTLDAIYDGMNIPIPLRSGSSAKNSTNNYVSLKTFIERLQYLRNQLIDFWTKQLLILQKSMNWDDPPQIIFDEMVLSDEVAEKGLILQLVDRNIISIDAVREYFGYIPDIESTRVKTDMSAHDKGSQPPKASPYHNPHVTEDYKKILLQSGDITPGEAGMQLSQKKEGEKTRIDKQQEHATQLEKYKPKVPGGRPSNVTENKKRKKKPNFRPRTKGYESLLMWTDKAASTINKILTPALLASYSKNNLRQLTTAEFDTVEKIKFQTLCAIEPYSKVTQELVYALLQTNMTEDNDITSSLKDLLLNFTMENGISPNTDEMRQLQVLSYVRAKTDSE